MNTLISMKKNLMLIAGLAMALSLTACSNNQPSGPRQRSNVTMGITNPQTGQVNTALQWGAIFNGSGSGSSSFQQWQLSDLTGGQTNIGTVSGNVNDSTGTGVLFRGQVDQNNGAGTIGIGIWDSNAAQGAAPFYWEMNVVQVSGVSGGNGATVTVQSDSSVFVFSGTFNGGMWQGTISIEDSSGSLTQIANFEIGACSIFEC